MEKCFASGLILGMIGGALIVANSYKARKLVKKSQNKINEAVSEVSKCMTEDEDEEYGDSEEE